MVARTHLCLGIVCLAWLGGAAQAAESAPTAVKSLRVQLPPEASPVVSRLAQVFARQVADRCDARVVTEGDAPLVVECAIDDAIGPEGFRIDDRPAGGVRVVGNGDRGLVAGVGKFLRTSRYDRGGFTPGAWRGTSVPQKPIRGIYFATHFHNFYHDAPPEKVAAYVEDLALWGFNELSVWYDMHHFDGFDDPEAVAFRDRLREILSTAKRIGMDVSLTLIGNEAYRNSPIELRAEGRGRGGWYPCAVCPSKPEGMNYILKIFGEELDWAADLKPRSAWIWPYDQGGCECAACRPWGSNGFMKCVAEVGRLARERIPGTKIVVSTWYMDATEWRSVADTLRARPGLVDAIMMEAMKDGAEPPFHDAASLGLPVIGFPEISMHETFPWGGFGATPLTRRAQEQWNAIKADAAGGFPYSEGIYEDLTKAVYAQFYWDDKPAEDTVKEYVAAEFSPDVVEEVAGVVKTLEQNHHFRWWPGKLDGVKVEMGWFPSKGVKPQEDPGAEEAYATMRRVDARLTPQARRSWRWRQLYLRALLDAELKANGGSPNDACLAAFAELIEIYHAQKAEPHVRPPLPRSVAADGLSYRSETRTEPRPLRIHVLRLDLASPHYEPTMIVNADPDGVGPAEAVLENPPDMAAGGGVVAAVNAAIFGGLPDAEGRRSSRWSVGMPVEMLGLIVADGRERSPSERPYPFIWCDGRGAGGVATGDAPDADRCRQAAAGFGMILRDAEIVAGEGGPLHPRTAAGVDEKGTTLVLCVVDGRRPGVSEGVSEHELAGIMRRLGCDDAVNLDGGGSSIMLLGDLDGTTGEGIRVMNVPSDGRPRPLPALFGIRRITRPGPPAR